MASIFENTHSKVTVHILHDDTLTDDNRQKFIRTAEKYSQGLELHDVTGYREELSKFTVKPSRLSVGVLYRLIIHEVLDVDKVILLDCDITFNLDIKELWEIDTDGKILAGVWSYGGREIWPERAIEARILGVDLKKYLNLGVVVMNLAGIREGFDFTEKWKDYLLRHKRVMVLPDEMAYNFVFAGNIKFIDERFNRFILDKDLSDCIIHTFMAKPWLGITGLKSERWYWKYYLRSAWGENSTADDIIDIMSEISAKNKPARQSVLRRAVLYISRKIGGSYPVLRVILMFRDILDRLTYRLTRKNTA
ncbi:MAG: hypothetical protein IJP86_01250 [Synergistaceae bacterium]|nr:hypothetical protein [Synergistaceae bacterium]